MSDKTKDSTPTADPQSPDAKVGGEGTVPPAPPAKAISIEIGPGETVKAINTENLPRPYVKVGIVG